MKNVELRKVQGIVKDMSFAVVIPKQMARDAGISKGDYVKIFREGKRIMIEKTNVSRDE